jgi:hypothetical protein
MNDTVSGGDMAECYRSFAVTKSGRIEFYMNIPSGNSDGLSLLLNDNGSWQKYPSIIYQLYIDVSGSLKWYDGATYQNFSPAASINFDSWLAVTANWNTSVNSLSLTIDGVYHGNGGSSKSTSAGIQQIVFQTASWSGVGNYGYFDDVTCYSLD